MFCSMFVQKVLQGLRHVSPQGFPRFSMDLGFLFEAKHESETSKLVEVALSEALQALAMGLVHQ